MGVHEKMGAWRKEMEAYKQTDAYKNFQEAKQNKKNKDKKKVLKKLKDKNAPKRPLSAYFLYLQSVRDQVHEELSTKSLALVGKKCGEMWAALNEESKKSFQDKAAALKVQYEKDLAEYKQTDNYKQFMEQKQRLMDEAKEAKKSEKKAKKVEEEKVEEPKPKTAKKASKAKKAKKSSKAKKASKAKKSSKA